MGNKEIEFENLFSDLEKSIDDNKFPLKHVLKVPEK